MLIRLFLSLALAILLVPPVFAADDVAVPSVLSFEMFTSRVLDHYPKLKQAHTNVDLALARKMQAEAGFWPSLELSAGYKMSDEPVNVFGMLLKEERFTSSDFDLKRMNSPARHQNFSGGVHLDIPLFDAMQTIGRSRTARELVKASQADEAFTRMEALLVAQDAYLNAVTLERVAVVVDEVQKASQEDLNKAAELKEKGMVLGADYYAARVMFGDLTRMKNEVSRQKKAMMALLNILMGDGVNRVWLLSGIKENEVSSFDLAGLIKAADEARPDIAALESRVTASGSEIAREHSSVLPKFSAFADVINDRNKLFASGGNNYALGIQGDIPLFDPAREGRVNEAKARKSLLLHDLQLLKDSIKRDLSMELAHHEAFLDNQPVLKGSTEDARQAMTLTVPLYNEGRKSIADLLGMRRTYVQAFSEYNKALTGLKLSEGRLYFLTGKLDQDQMKVIAEGSGL